MFMEREDIHRIEAIHDVNNPASGRVMEKLGMQFEGVLRRYMLHPNVSDMPGDCRMYALVK
jgi:[ribosomal protein S5]-alanine N-acetyltransferase